MYFMDFMNFAFIFTFFLLQRKKIYALKLGYFEILIPDPGLGPWETWTQENLDHEKRWI